MVDIKRATDAIRQGKKER